MSSTSQVANVLWAGLLLHQKWKDTIKTYVEQAQILQERPAHLTLERLDELVAEEQSFLKREERAEEANEDPHFAFEVTYLDALRTLNKLKFILLAALVGYLNANLY
jgi:hypothetical protein